MEDKLKESVEFVIMEAREPAIATLALYLDDYMKATSKREGVNISYSGALKDATTFIDAVLKINQIESVDDIFKKILREHPEIRDNYDAHEGIRNKIDGIIKETRYKYVHAQLENLIALTLAPLAGVIKAAKQL